jgi:D-alanyl-D-alanine carboxypeptidase
MKKPNLLIVLYFVLSIALTNAQGLEKQLDDHINTYLSFNSEQPVANILVYLENAKKDFTYNKGFGQLSLSNETPVEANSPFKIASITKMFTATLILQLVEDDKFKLNDNVVDLIGEIEFVDFDRLSVFNGKSYGSKITVRELLNHTSGLADIFTDTEKEFMARLFENPEKQWTTEDLFELYYEFGLNTRAHFKPGKGFHYSDVNYFLLGLLIEKYTNLPLAEAYRTYILQPAGMQNTYYEYHETAKNALPMPSSYIGNIELNKDINTSFDWAGGGLVSTTYDLNLFMKALFTSVLFKNKNLFEEMISESDNRYGYGIILYSFDDIRFYGHSGYWGSDVFYNPDLEITMVISVNQTNLPFNHREFVKSIYNLIK